jgi:methylenetetrahydrofolate reductase (NADPH)
MTNPLTPSPYGTGSVFAPSPNSIGKDINVSFEFFPPKTEKMETTLWASVKRLEPLNPSFFSVTYGAGGSTRERTHNTVKRIVDETNIRAAAHLTCVNATKEEVLAVAQNYWDAGIKHIVALRGDAPDDSIPYKPHPDGFESTTDLIKALKTIGDFEISVGAYPEMHPDSPNLAADLENLKQKIDAGATRAITQFFFDPDVYFRFLDHARSFGINVPIVPGILPVTNFKTLKNFAGSTGASIPPSMGDLFDGLDEDPKTRQLVAATHASEMCKRLYHGGVRDFHFYTLNRADLSYAICHLLGIRPV